MAQKSTHKTAKIESCLKVSDWVTFLASEKHGTISHIVSFGAFLVAIVALILATSGHIAVIIAGGIIAFGCVGWTYFRVLRPLQQRGKLADGILGRIMSGEIKDESSIRREWEAGLAALKRTRRHQRSSSK